MRNRKYMSAIIITTGLLLVGCGNKVEPVNAEPTGTVSEENTEESIEESVEISESESLDSIEDNEESMESEDSVESLARTEENESIEESEGDIENSESEIEIPEVEDESASIEIVEELDTTMFTQSTCNARSGDSTDYDKITSMSKGESVHVTGRTSNNWFRVDWNDEVVYISSKLLGVDKPVEQQQASSGNSNNNGSSNGGSSNGGSSSSSSNDGSNQQQQAQQQQSNDDDVTIYGYDEMGYPIVGYTTDGIPISDAGEMDWSKW